METTPDHEGVGPHQLVSEASIFLPREILPER